MRALAVRDTTLMWTALDQAPPWTVTGSDFDPEIGRIDLEIDVPAGRRCARPACNTERKTPRIPMSSSNWAIGMAAYLGRAARPAASRPSACRRRGCASIPLGSPGPPRIAAYTVKRHWNAILRFSIARSPTD